MKRGFTLVEILVVTGLVALIVTLLCTAFISATRFSALAEHRLADETEMSRVAEQIREQLVCLNTSPVRLYPIQLSTTGTHQDHIDFITSDLIKHGGIGDVAYEIDTDDRGKPYLAYREHGFVYPDNSLGNPGPFHPLSSLVTGIEFEFQGQTGWVHTWLQPLMPTQIRVSIWLADSPEPFVMEAEPALISVTPIGVTPGVGPQSTVSPNPLMSATPTAVPSTSVPSPIQ